MDSVPFGLAGRAAAATTLLQSAPAPCLRWTPACASIAPRRASPDANRRRGAPLPGFCSPFGTGEAPLLEANSDSDSECVGTADPRFHCTSCTFPAASPRGDPCLEALRLPRVSSVTPGALSQQSLQSGVHGGS